MKVTDPHVLTLKLSFQKYPNVSTKFTVTIVVSHPRAMLNMALFSALTAIQVDRGSHDHLDNLLPSRRALEEHLG